MSRFPEGDELVRYLTGDETEIPAQKDARSVVQTVRDIVALDHGLPAPPNPALARAQLMAKLREPVAMPAAVHSDTGSALPNRQTVRASQTQRLTPTMRYVFASVVLSAFFLVAGWYSGARHTSARFVASVSTYTTANGQRATITLPDGSTALLNVGSRLEVPTDYVAGNRVIHLKGEAFFTVSHHSGTPFTVVAGPSKTRVLGTRFAVRHYATDTAASVTVSEGKVAVGSVVLAANQQITVSRFATGQARPANPGQFGFTVGVLKLNAVPLKDALPELSRWYDADIQLGDLSLATRRVTGECAVGSLADLAEILELTFDIRVIRVGRVLTLYPKG